MTSDSSSLPSPASEAIHAKGLPEARDWRHAHRLFGRSQSWGKRAILPAFLLLFAAWVLWRLHATPLAFAFALGLPLYVFLIKKYRQHASIRRIESMARKLDAQPEWIFEPRQITSIWGDNRSVFQWTILEKISLDNELLLLYPTPRNFHCIPLRHLGEGAGVDEIVNYARAACVPIRDFRKGKR